MPLYRLQQLAFENDAAGYRSRVHQGRHRRHDQGDDRPGARLARHRHGARHRCSRGPRPACHRSMKVLRVLPILPIVVPAVAAVIGWAFLLSPRPGYLNALLRNLPWWDHLEEGPVDIYTMPWIVIITGFGLTAFVYLFVSSGFANINSELLEAAQVSGSRGLGVFFRITLPLLRPVLVYGGGVALLLGLGQFTGPLLLGRNAGITVLTTQMYFFDVAIADRLRRRRRHRLAAAAVRRARGRRLRRSSSATRPASSPTAARRSGPTADRRSSPSAAIVGYSFLATILPVTALVIVALSTFWSADIDVASFTLDNFREVRDTPGITNAITTSIVSSLTAVAHRPAGRLLRRHAPAPGTEVQDHAAGDRLPRHDAARASRRWCSASASCSTYTQEPFFLYGTRWVIILVYVTLMLPFTTRMQLGGHGVARQHLPRGGPCERCRRAAHERATSSCRCCGRPSAGPAALMFVLLTHEFAASLLVRAPTTQVMGTVLFDFYTNGSYPTGRRDRPGHDRGDARSA